MSLFQVTVRDLIQFLKEQDPEMLVFYRIHSDPKPIELDEITVARVFKMVFKMEGGYWKDYIEEQWANEDWKRYWEERGQKPDPQIIKSVLLFPGN